MADSPIIGSFRPARITFRNCRGGYRVFRNGSPVRDQKTGKLRLVKHAETKAMRRNLAMAGHTTPTENKRLQRSKHQQAFIPLKYTAQGIWDETTQFTALDCPGCNRRNIVWDDGRGDPPNKCTCKRCFAKITIKY